MFAARFLGVFWFANVALNFEYLGFLLTRDELLFVRFSQQVDNAVAELSSRQLVHFYVVLIEREENTRLMPSSAG